MQRAFNPPSRVRFPGDPPLRQEVPVSGKNLAPHDHVPEIGDSFGTSIYVKHGDTGKFVCKRGPFLQWRLRRALKITKHRHDRGTERERRVSEKVIAVRSTVLGRVAD
jgi:hypothetical protein